MSTPNISKEEVAVLVSTAPANIHNALAAYVKEGRLSKAEADSYELKAVINPLPASVMILAIRGYFKKSMGRPQENDRNIYDDAIILLAPDLIMSFNGNTDPRQYKQGIAMLLPGWHVFKKGVHHPGKPGEHAAFRTANAREVLPVLRDGEVGIKEGVTLNLHKGGVNSTNSAGCQTIVPDQWKKFQTTAYSLMDKYGQKNIPYLLLENLSV